MSHNGTSSTHPNVSRRTAPFEQIVRTHLERILESPSFDGSARSRDFLSFVVGEVLAGRGDRLTQTVIATRVFGRKGEFDATLDPVVRVQAGRLRRSLERYYLLTGDTSTIRIELPKGSYAPSFATAVTRKDGGQTTLRRISLAVVAPEWPAIVIHPFAASETEDGAMASCVTDELMRELCRYGDVRVIFQRDMERLEPRQQSVLRFELRGKLRRAGASCVIGAWLIDRTTGEQVWADEFHATAGTRAIDDVARIVAARVGGEHGLIVRTLASEHGAGNPVNASSVSAIASCYHFFFSRNVHDLIPIVEALQRVIVREPETALAWAYLARLYQINYAFELTQLATPIDRAISYAYQGVGLEPTWARIRCILAAALLVKGELQAARDEIEQVLQLNAGSFAYREISGWLLALAGDWERGIALMREATARNPYCLPHVNHGLWADHLRRGQFEQAYMAALEYRDTCFFWREAMIACCLGHLGRSSDARVSVAELLRLKPSFPVRGRALIGCYIKPPDLRETIFDGLRKAGLALSAAV